MVTSLIYGNVNGAILYKYLDERLGFVQIRPIMFKLTRSDLKTRGADSKRGKEPEATKSFATVSSMATFACKRLPQSCVEGEMTQVVAPCPVHLHFAMGRKTGT